MNPHDVTTTRSLVLLVCQFRHFRICTCAPRKYDIITFFSICQLFFQKCLTLFFNTIDFFTFSNIFQQSAKVSSHKGYPSCHCRNQKTSPKAYYCECRNTKHRAKHHTVKTIGLQKLDKAKMEQINTQGARDSSCISPAAFFENLTLLTFSVKNKNSATTIIKVKTPKLS